VWEGIEGEVPQKGLLKVDPAFGPFGSLLVLLATAFAAFRLATIYLPQCLLLKWVVVKYSGVPLPFAGGYFDFFQNLENPFYNLWL
jgi:hypothetical protein